MKHDYDMNANGRDVAILELTEGGPMETHIAKDKSDTLKAEYTTYELVDGVLYKRTTVRKYNEAGDYNDHYTSEPIVRV
tara:strand:+ start:105 stop:341 length:237 start_codon:yes stop_codon:yes gene_type:complete